VIALLLVIFALFGAAPMHPAEDAPGWDCHTMGNHRCGPGR
jgi:hypothetical protein